MQLIPISRFISSRFQSPINIKAYVNMVMIRLSIAKPTTKKTKKQKTTKPTSPTRPTMQTMPTTLQSVNLHKLYDKTIQLLSISSFIPIRFQISKTQRTKQTQLKIHKTINTNMIVKPTMETIFHGRAL